MIKDMNDRLYVICSNEQVVLGSLKDNCLTLIVFFYLKPKMSIDFEYSPKYFFSFFELKFEISNLFHLCVDLRHFAFFLLEKL